MRKIAFVVLLASVPLSLTYAASVGGNVAPDGTEIQIDLPDRFHTKNTASHNLGLCVFTSIHHSAIWQDVPQLIDFPKWMIQKSIPGGGYPQKVAALIPQICKDKGMPTPDYIQVENDDLEILKLACKTGRMPCVTYCYSFSGRYGKQKIAHMVNISHCDDKYVCVLDNNFPGISQYEWLTPAEFQKTYSGMGGGWAVILLNPGPPPIPTGL